jgi:histidine triad (HIT) family protein
MDTMEPTVFEKIINRELPADIIFEDSNLIVILDISPNNPGHALVIPKTKSVTIIDTPDHILCSLITTVRNIAPIIMKAVGAQGFNLHVNNGDSAGQMVPHLHFHIIPRFKEDGLTHWHRNITQSHEERSLLAKEISKMLSR